jgi:general secretion pathway protein I
MSTRLRVYQSSKGFSLLEVLVAFVILALVLGVLMQIFSGGLRNTKRAGEYQQAMLLAQSKLEGIGIETALEEGVSSGDFDDIYHWKLEISPYQDEQVSAPGPKSIVLVKLLQVDLSVEWPGRDKNRVVRLKTLRLASQADI